MSEISGYSFSLSDSSNGKPLRLVVQHHGRDLGEQFAVAVEKTQSELIVDSKYVGVPLKIKDAEGHETWVKIDKSDLKSKFHLAKSDLSEIESAEELQNLMINQLHRNLKLEDNLELSGIKKSFHNFIKFFIGSFVLAPAVKSAVNQALAGKNIGAIRDLYIKDTANIVADVKERLKEKNENVLYMFDDQIISEIVDARIMQEVNKMQEKEKLPSWDGAKIKELHDLRVVDYLKRHPDKVSKKHLKKIDIFNLPVSVLASIPITDKNIEIMSKTWQQAIGKPYVEGRLDVLNVERDKRGIIIQAHHAGKYLEAYHALPKKIKDHLATSLDDLHKNGKQLEHITNFAIQNHANLENIVSNDPKIQQLQQEQKIYNEKIRPLIQDKIKENMFYSVLDLLRMYTYMEGREVDNANLISNIHKNLNVEEKAFFSEKKLTELIGREIEFVAINEYHLTTSQMQNLSDYREKYNQKLEEHRLFTEELKSIKSPLELLKIFDLKDLKNRELLPSIFDEFYERGYITSPLTDLDRDLVIGKLKLVVEKFNELEVPIQTLSKEDKIKLHKYKEKLISEIFVSKEYNKGMKVRNNNYRFNNEKFRRGNDHLNKLLFTEKVKEEIQNDQNYLFKPEYQIGLMELTHVMDHIKLNRIRSLKNLKIFPLSKEELKRTQEFLKIAKEDPEFLKIIKLIRKKDSSAELDKLFSFLPSFLHTIINKIAKTDSTNNINRVPAGISKNTIDFLVVYMDRLNQFEKMNSNLQNIIQKGINLLDKFEQDRSQIEKKDRLSLKETGMLSAMQRLNESRFPGVKWSFTEELQEFGIDVSLEPFNERIKESSIILNKLNEIVQSSINKNYRETDIFAYNALKKEAWQGRASTQEQKMTALIANNLTHGGKLYIKNKEIYASHLVGGVINKKLELYELAISDVWGLDLTSLIPKTIKNKISDIFGKKGIEMINDMYKSIENEYQLKWKKEDKFEDLENNAERRFAAGLANYEPLLIGRPDIKGPERKDERDFEKLYEKFTNDTEIKQKMICSEFVSKVTLVSMIELNKQLSKMIIEKMGTYFDNKVILEDMKDKKIALSQELEDYANGVRHYGDKRDVTKAAEKEWRKILKGRGYSESEIEITIRVGNQEILDLPYSRKERLKAIHPGRMVSLLADKGCVTKRPVPPEVAMLLDIE